MVDARANYISYAEKVGEDEALRALEEFADRASDDHEIRLLLAAQMEQLERNEEAARQLLAAFNVLSGKGLTAEAEALQGKIHELDPDLPIGSAPVAAGADDSEEVVELVLTSAVGDGSDELETDFGDFDLGGEDEESDSEEPAAEVEAGEELGGFELDSGDDEADEPDDDDSPLPMMSFDDDEEDEPLPTFATDEASEAEEVEPLPTFSMDEASEGEEVEPLPTFAMDEASEEEEAEPQPTLSMDDASDEEELEPLPTFSHEEEDTEGEDSLDLPLTSFHEEEEAVPEASVPVVSTEDEPGPSDAIEAAMEDAVAEGPAEPPVPAEPAAVSAAEPAAEEPVPEQDTAASGHEALAEAGDFSGAIDALDAEISGSPDDVQLRQRRVEYAFRVNEGTVLSTSYFGLATALESDGQDARAKAVYQQALEADANNADASAALARMEGGAAAEAPAEAPSGVASTDDYIDLGAMILDSVDEEKSTRFVVAYEEPTGDEDADFSRMLAQFKEKVSESIDADDVTAHYDLGTAYKEMGLLDEAIHEYQQALRAESDHLATYEMLGQTFLEKGENEAAVRSLTRALDAEYEIEDELMGIYYYLAKAHQALGNNAEAIEFYDRVFTLDINFADVTERLRALRP